MINLHPSSPEKRSSLELRIAAAKRNNIVLRAVTGEHHADSFDHPGLQQEMEASVERRQASPEQLVDQGSKVISMVNHHDQQHVDYVAALTERAKAA